MRLLLDEQLSPRIAQALSQRGHDVASVAWRTDLAGLGDDEVLAAARREGRAVVTNNVRDFRPRAAQAVLDGARHFGIVLLPGAYRHRRADVGRIVEALQAVLVSHPGEDDLVDAELWL